MDNTFNLLKNARSAIMDKMQEHENRIEGGFMRVMEASLANDYSDFTNDEKEAYMVWQAYSEVLLALAKADEKLAQAVEIETESNLVCK